MDPFLLLLIGGVIVIGGIVWLRLHAFIALFLAAIVVAALTPRENIEQAMRAQGKSPQESAARAQETLGAKLAGRFGNTCTDLGVLIAMASIVGACLLASGGAERIVRSVLGVFAEKRAPLVFATSGFVLGVPVFFDTVFLILIPLARVMATRTGRNYLLYVLAIVVGTSMTHSLVPPTPGPLFVASALKVDIGLMIIGGLIVSAAAASCGLAYAWWANRRWPLAVRGGSDDGPAIAPAAERPDPELPPLWLALAPIVLPLLLISVRTTADLITLPAGLVYTVKIIGHPNIALALAAAVALAVLARRRDSDRNALRATVQSALTDAGSIILVTAAGGVFGGILQESGVGERIQDLAREYRIAVLPLAYLVTALIRTAQGSSTVAMVTSVGIVGGFSSAATLGFHPLYLALTIGCASKLIPWMNDSGFWVVCKASGMTERETLRSMSVMASLMGLTGFALVIIAAKLFPLV